MKFIGFIKEIKLRKISGEPLKCLDEWQLLLVVFFATGSLDSSRLSPGDAVLRVFEVR